MNFGGPVWHASVSFPFCRDEDEPILRALALAELAGVGDPATDRHEWTGRAYHVRRRLTAEEQAGIGPALDCRGTAEWSKRYYGAVRELPEPAKRLAQLEMVREEA